MTTQDRLKAIAESFHIVKTGHDAEGNTYTSTGQLNQAAWIGEQAGFLLARIESLESALKCALSQDPAHWKDIGQTALIGEKTKCK